MSPSPEKLHGLRILVAEDEALILLDIEDMLHDLGCEIVGPVATVDAAMSAIRQSAMDGAILDVSLHGERITPAADALRARGIRFILCTGYGRNPDDEPAIRDAPRLAKPFTLDSLRAAVTDAFAAGRT